MPSKPLSSKPPSAIRAEARPSSQINQRPHKPDHARQKSFVLAPSSPSNLNVISASFVNVSRTPSLSPPPTKRRNLPPHQTDDNPTRLPDELEDLVNLHSSFLTALSLHYAHNGSPTPADLAVLRQSIERSWRRRRVTIDDVRRILGIEQDIAACGGHVQRPPHHSVLSLSDYGRGKICVEMNTGSHLQEFRRRPLDEEALNSYFTQSLIRQWELYSEKNKPSPSAAAFLKQLPLAPITLCTSISKISPLLAKGQRRLEDLKAGAIRAQQNSKLLPPPSPSAPTTKNHPTAQTPAPSRNTDLLSRIRAKQQKQQHLHQSTLTPTTQAEILHASALQRLAEIIPVLELLTATTTTSTSSPQPTAKTKICSFTMPTLVQHLQTSLRNPIAKDDTVRCVRLLASEVAPAWVSVREVGSVVAVTVRGGGGGGWEEGKWREDLRRRIEALERGVGG